MEKNPKAKKILHLNPGVYAGDGPLHTLMRTLGITVRQFSEIAGISERAVHHWRGFPLSDWPVRLLTVWARMRAMEDYLSARGIDIQQFEATLPTELHKAGRYPRKRGDVDVSNIPLGTYSPWDRL